MMGGIRLEQSIVGGKPVWIVIDLKTQRVVATGGTPSEAVGSFEQETENEQ